MIWAIVSSEEMEGFGTPNIFRYYQEAIGKENIKLAVVDAGDALDFVDADDIVLLRTGDEKLINTIKSKGTASTAEGFEVYKNCSDKSLTNEIMLRNGILMPVQHDIASLEEGKCYFVKPKCGSDSKGISESSICHSIANVRNQIDSVKEELGQDCVIEDYIEGEDYTVACIKHDASIHTYAIKVDCTATGGIQTNQCKYAHMECMSAVYDEKLASIARKAFDVMGFKHHARIDFRKATNGDYYLLDVNPLPGLGPVGLLARAMLLTENISYIDAVRTVIKSAS